MPNPITVMMVANASSGAAAKDVEDGAIQEAASDKHKHDSESNIETTKNNDKVVEQNEIRSNDNDNITANNRKEGPTSIITSTTPPVEREKTVPKQKEASASSEKHSVAGVAAGDENSSKPESKNNNNESSTSINNNNDEEEQKEEGSNDDTTTRTENNDAEVTATTPSVGSKIIANVENKKVGGVDIIEDSSGEISLPTTKGNKMEVSEGSSSTKPSMGKDGDGLQQWSQLLDVRTKLADVEGPNIVTTKSDTNLLVLKGHINPKVSGVETTGKSSVNEEKAEGTGNEKKTESNGSEKEVRKGFLQWLDKAKPDKQDENLAAESAREDKSQIEKESSGNKVVGDKSDKPQSGKVKSDEQNDNEKLATESAREDKSKVEKGDKIAQFINGELTKAMIDIVEKWTPDGPDTRSSAEKQAVGQSIEPSAKKKRKLVDVDATKKAIISSATKRSKVTSSQRDACKVIPTKEGGNVVKVSLRLPPPPQKLGLSIKDDTQHSHGLPVLMALHSESPFRSSFPPHLVGKFWIVRIKSSACDDDDDDDDDGRTKEKNVTDGMSLQAELAKRRRENEETMVELTFESRGSLPLLEVEEPPPRSSVVETTQPPPLPRNSEAQLQQAHLNVESQRLQQQQQLTDNNSGTNNIERKQPQQSNSLHSPPPIARGGTVARNDKAKGMPPKLLQGGYTMTPDEIVRKALSDFFAEGEKRALVTFCQAFFHHYSTISDEVSNNPGLCDLLVKRTPGEGFRKEDSEAALEHINEIFSSNHRKKKRKVGNDPGEQRKKPNLPPILLKINCKGLQSKWLDEFCVDPLNDLRPLYENKSNISNFQGWRHKDCLFKTDLDRHNRCPKCTSAYKNIRRQHPIIFEKAKPTEEKTLLPESQDIRKFIIKRLEEMDDGDETSSVLPNDDPQLTMAAKVMKIKGKTKLNLVKKVRGGKNLFMLCADCDCYMLKQSRKNTKTRCKLCQNRKFMKKFCKERADLRKDERVDPSSNVTYRHLSNEELGERCKNFKKLNKALQCKVKTLEKKNEKAKQKAADNAGQPAAKSARKNQHPRAPLLPWPFYLNYNPIIAQDYSMPMTLATTPASKNPATARSTAKGHNIGIDAPVNSKSSSNTAVKATSSKAPNGNTIPRSDHGKPSAKEEVKEVAVSSKGDASKKAHEIIAGDIADESQDDASFGSSKEESITSTKNNDDVMLTDGDGDQEEEEEDDDDDDVMLTDGDQEEDSDGVDGDDIEIDGEDENGDDESINEGNGGFDGHLV